MNLEETYKRCMSKSDIKCLSEIVDKYKRSEMNEKIKLTIRMMDKIKDLEKLIESINNGMIEEETIKYYREMYLELEEIKYNYRHYGNELKKIINETTLICCEKRENKKLRRSMYKIDNNKRYKNALNKEEKRGIEIIKSYLNRGNSLIKGNVVLDVKYKNNLRADILVYVDYFAGLKLIIEYDGESHYNSDYIYYSEENIKRDKIKDSYCENNGISIIRYNKNDKLLMILKKVICDMRDGKVIYCCDYRDEYRVVCG
jgi:very-short-patch-repair endonuclease